MATLYHRINDNIGPLIFDTYSQSDKTIYTLVLSDGPAVAGTLLSKSLTKISIISAAGVVYTYPLTETFDYTQQTGPRARDR